MSFTSCATSCVTNEARTSRRLFLLGLSIVDAIVCKGVKRTKVAVFYKTTNFEERKSQWLEAQPKSPPRTEGVHGLHRTHHVRALALLGCVRLCV